MPVCDGIGGRGGDYSRKRQLLEDEMPDRSRTSRRLVAIVPDGCQGYHPPPKSAAAVVRAVTERHGPSGDGMRP
jgi:hypothetical protein